MKKIALPVLLASALLPPLPSYALGLGDIRLKSALNQTFDAEIDLVSATTDELAGLRVTLADNETFKRYGLDRPAVLSNFSLRVDSVNSSHPIIKVVSSNVVNEPFLSLLVDVSWSGGRLLREYTLFLDPPVLSSMKSASAVVQSPSVGVTNTAPVVSTQKSVTPTGTLTPSATSPKVPAPVATAPATYRVKPSDSLFKIANTLKSTTRASVKQTMLAIYRANPTAFGGDMDLLRAGSVLRIPAPADIQSISDTETATEMKSQSQSIPKASEAVAVSAKPNNERLRLVPAQQSSVASGDQINKPSQAAATSTAAVNSVNDRIKVLEAELAEAKRLIDVKSAELAQIQQQLAVTPAEAGAAQSSQSTESVSSAVSSEVSASSAAAQSPSVAQNKAEVASAAKSETPKIMQTWLALVAKNSVTIIASALGLIMALLLLVRWRQRRTESEDFAAFSDEKDFPEYSQDRSSDQPQAVTHHHLDQPADRSHEFSQTLPPGSSLEDTTTTRPILSDITLSGETALHVKQHDVLAEAEFHLAYGLYDQAADIIKRAMERQPERHELKLKLAEIYFASGNKEAFIDLARKLRDESAHAPQDGWDKVLTMGRQLCPQDPLFTHGASVSAGKDSIDVPLEEGEHSLDMDLYDVSEGSGLSAVVTQSSDQNKVDSKDQVDDLDFSIDDSQQAMDEDTSSTRRTGTFNFSPPQTPKGEDLFVSHVDEPTVKTATLSLDEMDFDLDHLEGNASSAAAMGSDVLSDQTIQDTRVHGATEVDHLLTDDSTVDVTRPQKILDQALQSEDAESAMMNEVGTKLDLARAYMDMGDPDGARSILQEVLQEGTAGQKLEAERLLSSIG